MERLKLKTLTALKQPFYLWIVGCYPILHLYIRNSGLVNFREVLLTALAALAATSLAFVMTRRLFRDIHARAFVLAIWSLAHSLSGHIYVEWIIPFSLTIWTLALVVMLISLTLIARRSFLGSSNLPFPTTTLNIVALVMLAMQLPSLAAKVIEDIRAESIADAFMAAHAQSPNVDKAQDSPELPDIYYIIPDAYPSDGWHMEAMNHDNSAFSEALRALGFQVVPHAQSNYSATVLSLASTLNMRYFQSNPTNYTDLGYLSLALNNSDVARELLRRGYTYVQLRSGTIGPSPIADVNKAFTGQAFIDSHHPDFELSLSDLLNKDMESFAALYIDSTLLRAVRSQLSKLAQLLPISDISKPGYWQSTRFLQSLKELETIAEMPEATFTIAHLMKPHWPVTFNREGDIIGSFRHPRPDQYFGELGFINERLLATLAKLIEAAPRETVIILQADHGSTYGRSQYSNPLNTYFEVYAGYYVPADSEVVFPNPFTLVNSFPLLLNALFDTDFGLQEDRFFTLETGYDDPLNQREVTQEWLQE